MNENSPWWVAGIMSTIGVGYALYRLFAFIRGNNREAERKKKNDETADRRDERRDSATEAWQVVDRLTKEVEGHSAELRELREQHGKKIAEIEDRERVCAEERATEAVEHAATRTVLRMLVAWARKQKNPPPLPDDVLTQLSDGSGTHPPTIGGGDAHG